MNIRTLFFWLIMFVMSPHAYALPIELVLWHAMAGDLGDEVQLLADEFNQSQNTYRLKVVYKGDYIETLTSFAAAFRAHQAPDLVQIFEVGSEIMLHPKGVVKPVDALLKEQGLSIPKEDFIQSVRQYYSRDGELMAMPFNLSIPALFYNVDALNKVGYHQTQIPSTWQEMEHLAEAFKKAGYDCTYTSAYPGWVLFESYLAIHGLPLTQEHPLRALFNSLKLQKHYERMKRWSRLHYFRYGGRFDDATIFFTSGVCPLLSQSSGSYNSLVAISPFRVGVALMPLDTSASSVRHANIAGGAALWVSAKQKEDHYPGIAQFISFIAQPKVQKRWHEHTGYLPVGLSGVYADIAKTSTRPTLLLAQKDLASHQGSVVVKHYGPQNQIRSINDELFEAILSGLITPKEALNQAIIRSNHLLERFERNTSDKGRIASS